MTDRITKRDVERQFTEAVTAARAAGLNTDGWRFETGTASMGIAWTLSTGQHGSSSVYIGSFDRIGGTAKEAYTYLKALTAAWNAVAQARPLTPAVAPGWYVINNITAARVSRAYDTEDAANRICRELNLQAGPGGLYGVQEVKP